MEGCVNLLNASLGGALVLLAKKVQLWYVSVFLYIQLIQKQVLFTHSDHDDLTVRDDQFGQSYVLGEIHIGKFSLVLSISPY
jgi:hypothetical protein